MQRELEEEMIQVFRYFNNVQLEYKTLFEKASMRKNDAKVFELQQKNHFRAELKCNRRMKNCEIESIFDRSNICLGQKYKWKETYFF